MLSNFSIFDIMFIDIETTPQNESYDLLDDATKALWDKKAEIDFYALKNNLTPSETYERAGIYAEFGKIVCISVGLFFTENNEIKFKLKSFYNENEMILIKEFIETLNNFCKSPKQILCAHNGKEFDFPYIARRIIINGLEIPKALNLAGKKPWEINHLDTMELWKFGDYKHYTSLSLLAHVFGIPTPKDDIDGSMVHKVYYKEKNIKRIAEYCQKDVVTTAQVLLKYMGKDLMKEANIIH